VVAMHEGMTHEAATRGHRVTTSSVVHHMAARGPSVENERNGRRAHNVKAERPRASDASGTSAAAHDRVAPAATIVADDQVARHAAHVPSNASSVWASDINTPAAGSRSSPA
jgi:hypothetical protein